MNDIAKKTPTFIRVTGVVVHLVRARDGHGEDVSDLGRVGAALGTQLQDVELLHLQMLDGPAVLQQQTLAAELHLAEGAVVQQLGVSVVAIQLLLLPPQVGEDGGGDLVALVGRVDLQLVDAVSLEIKVLNILFDKLDSRCNREALSDRLILVRNSCCL